MSGRSIVIGTAGHIDHGKSALVRALTGIDPDRLKEERERGITIDLGFAHVEAGDTTLSFVDVPGHERFVKNMLAGAGGIDLVMLVVAADESVMPQTREHFDICRLLDLRAGLIVLTKCDIADPDMQELAALEARELTSGSFLEDAPILRARAVVVCRTAPPDGPAGAVADRSCLQREGFRHRCDGNLGSRAACRGRRFDGAATGDDGHRARAPRPRRSAHGGGRGRAGGGQSWRRGGLGTLSWGHTLFALVGRGDAPLRCRD